MKIFGTVLTIIVFGFFGLVATIIASLERNAEFYTVFIPTITMGLIIATILAIYGKLKDKRLKVSAMIFFSLCVISVAVFEGYQTYLKSIEIASTQDVDLSEYRPFAENTKAVSLNEPSTFKIKDNLPLLDGATALYPVYSAFVQAVYPQKDYPLEESEVVSSQTTYAFERLLNGEVLLHLINVQKHKSFDWIQPHFLLMDNPFVDIQLEQTQNKRGIKLLLHLITVDCL